jgi:plasmid stabilization system protein ParE
MNSDSYDILRRAVVEALGPRATPERRRQIAAELRALAEQQERMAERAETQPASDATGRRTEHAAGMYIRIRHESDPLTGARRIRLLFGKQIWFDLGSPERIAIQPAGTEIWIVEAKGRSGLRVETDVGLPGCVVPDGTPLERLAPGRYAATLRAGALVIGARIR